MLPNDPSKPSDSLSPSEISALGESSFRRGSRLSRALAARTPAFRLYWTLFTVVVLGYIVANSSGYLSGYLAFGWTGQFFDLQMQQVRFLMCLTMLACGYLWLVLGREIVHLLLCSSALCLYFAGTGLARLEFAMGDTPDFTFLSVFIAWHCTCLSLLLLLVREEVRSDVLAR
ncbi:hypothetical protein N9393_01990 [Luminiphilus sp.]|nr:hypothetical protein [Luminiphilus sp.]